jgi:hypothetical protein
VPHQDLVPVEVQVVDAEAQALHHPHAAAVQHQADEVIRAGQLGQQAGDLVPAQDHRQPLRPSRPDHPRDAARVDLQHLLVQEQQGAERLVLGRGADVPLHRQVRQESVDLRRPHLLRVALAVEEDEPPDPADVGLLRPPTVMAHPRRLPHPVEQARRARRRGALP